MMQPKGGSDDDGGRLSITWETQPNAPVSAKTTARSHERLFFDAGNYSMRAFSARRVFAKIQAMIDTPLTINYVKQAPAEYKGVTGITGRGVAT